jgi:hypothetical protein
MNPSVSLCRRGLMTMTERRRGFALADDVDQRRPRAGCQFDRWRLR